MSSDITVLYIVSALSIIMVVVLLMQMFKKKGRLLTDKTKNYNILVDTPKGLVLSDNHSLAKELEDIKYHLSKQTVVHSDELTQMIDTAMKNLVRFIQENPRLNSEALCKLELRADLVNRSMSESVNPEASDWDDSYRSVLDWEAYERDLPTDARERLKYLINNIDIAIKMMRNNVCDNGQINIIALHKILLHLKDQVNKYGADADLSFNQSGVLKSIEFGIQRNTFNKPPKVPLFSLDQISIEPFESRLSMDRQVPRIGSFAKLASDDRLVPVGDYSEVRRYSPVGDNSMEGSVERDILGYKPPGHIIAQLHDPYEFYTIRVGSCGGKTVPDSELIKECVSEDIKYANALNGDATRMLDCIGGSCDADANSTRWYEKVYDSTGLDIRW